MAEEECPDAQLCQEGQYECFWRDGLTGDACDQWTARAVWHVRELSWVQCLLTSHIHD